MRIYLYFFNFYWNRKTFSAYGKHLHPVDWMEIKYYKSLYWIIYKVKAVALFTYT